MDGSCSVCVPSTIVFSSSVVLACILALAQFISCSYHCYFAGVGVCRGDHSISSVSLGGVGLPVVSVGLSWVLKDSMVSLWGVFSCEKFG